MARSPHKFPLQTVFRSIVASLILVVWIISNDPASNSLNAQDVDAIDLYRRYKFPIDPIHCEDVPMDTAPHYTIQTYREGSTSAVVDFASWSSHRDSEMKDDVLD